MFKILIILGTGRLNCQSAQVASWVLKEAQQFGFEVELIKLKDWPITFTDNIAFKQDWKTKVSTASGLIIVAPEYNHGYPGELKLLLDLAYEEYNRKPLGLVGVSSGLMGGVRMMEQLRQVAIEFQLIPIRTAVYIKNVSTVFGPTGVLQETVYSDKLQELLTEFNWYLTKLKS